MKKQAASFNRDNWVFRWKLKQRSGRKRKLSPDVRDQLGEHIRGGTVRNASRTFRFQLDGRGRQLKVTRWQCRQVAKEKELVPASHKLRRIQVYADHHKR